MHDLIWIEISRKALKNNIKTLRRIVGRNTILAPSVKANAYGHGLVGTAKLSLKYGADWLCVDSVDEAEDLRRAGVRQPILIIGYIQKKDIKRALELNTKVIVYNLETVKKLSSVAGRLKKKAVVHVKIDTGMSRQGVKIDQALDFIKFIQGTPNLKLEGIATHYASSDEPRNIRFFNKQLKEFRALIREIKEAGIKIPIIHTSNSGATLLHPEARFNMVRPGLLVFGYFPSRYARKINLQKSGKLLPTLTLKTKVAQVKEIEKGDCVSYCCTFTAKKRTKIAVLPIGYYDGLDRRLSNAGEVLIRGERCRILGRVCMNITVVDVTKVSEVKLEDEVVIIGEQGQDEVSVEEVAKIIGTINYEVTTRLRESISRSYI